MLKKFLNALKMMKRKLKLLNEIYEKQGSWAGGSDINSINKKSLKLLIITD